MKKRSGSTLVFLALIHILAAKTTYAQVSANSCIAAFSPPTIVEHRSSLKPVEKVELLNSLIRSRALNSDGDLDWAISSLVADRLKPGQQVTDVARVTGDQDSPAHANHLWLQSITVEPLKDQTEENSRAITLIGNDIFPDGFFFRHGLTKTNQTRELTKIQPWLEYKSETKSYLSHRGGAQDQYAKYFTSGKKSVVLYRGITNQSEADFLSIMKELQSNKFDASAVSARWIKAFDELVEELGNSGKDSTAFRNQFSNRFAAFSEGLKTSNMPSVNDAVSLLVEASSSVGRDAVFSTPDLDTAKKWGQFGLIAFKIPAAEFRKMSANGDVYIGIENQYEVALISKEAQNYSYLKSVEPIKNFRATNSRAD